MGHGPAAYARYPCLAILPACPPLGRSLPRRRITILAACRAARPKRGASCLQLQEARLTPGAGVRYSQLSSYSRRAMEMMCDAMTLLVPG